MAKAAAKRKPMTEKTINVCEAGSYLSIKKFEFHPDNPRTISRDRLDDLKRSIIEKGIYQPFLIWAKGNIILAGNQRTKACIELMDDGYTFVNAKGEKDMMPVVIEEVEDNMAEAILFDSNNSYGNWVEERLAVAMSQAKDAGKDLSQWGFTQEAVDDLLKDALKGVEDLTTTKVGEHERTTGGKKDDEDDGTPTEKQEALILPKSLYLKVVDIFQDIAYQLDNNWRDGDSLIPAIEKFVEFTYQEGVPDLATWVKEQK